MPLSEEGLARARASIDDLRRDGQPQTIGAELRNQLRALLADRDALAAEVAALKGRNGEMVAALEKAVALLKEAYERGTGAHSVMASLVTANLTDAIARAKGRGDAD